VKERYKLRGLAEVGPDGEVTVARGGGDGIADDILFVDRARLEVGAGGGGGEREEALGVGIGPERRTLAAILNGVDDDLAVSDADGGEGGASKIGVLGDDIAGRGGTRGAEE
jgi:hypothetical protein